MMHTWKAWPQQATAAMACALICTVVATGAERASFQPLGDLPGGAFTSMVADITPDGSLAVGYSKGDQTEGFRWTASAGMAGLGVPASGSGSTAVAVSHDGAVIAGSGYVGGSSRPVYWNAVDELIELPILAQHGRGMTNDISADGAVIVGQSGDHSDGAAVRWVDGVIEELLPGVQSGAGAVSADGSVVAGWSGTNDLRAFRWTAGTGAVDLGMLSGYGTAHARAISADGNVLAGSCDSSSLPRQAFRWTSSGGMVALSNLVDNCQSEAYAVSADGHWVGGISDSVAVLWDDAGVARKVEDILLEDHGIEIPGWYLNGVTALSADGQVIAGYGYNPDGQLESWIARIPEPNGLLLLVFGLTLMAGWRQRN